jgi:hypothetical protein
MLVRLRWSDPMGFPGPFHFVHSVIRRGEKTAGGGVITSGRGADTDTDFLQLIAGKDRCRECGADGVRDRSGGRFVGAGKDDNELVAAESADEIPGPKGALQAASDFDEDLIASGVAAAIVHLLESVEITEEDDDLVLVAIVDNMVELREECAPT